MKILLLDAQACDVLRGQLADLLMDALDLERRQALCYWQDVRMAVAAGSGRRRTTGR